MEDERVDEAHGPETEDEPQDLPYPLRGSDANWTRQRLEELTEERFLAEVQRALCDVVGDAAERVRPVEDYLPLLEALMYAWDEFGLPRGCSCGTASDGVAEDDVREEDEATSAG